MRARQAKTPTDTTHPKIAEPQMRPRLLCLLARDPSLIKPAVTLPLTSVLSATRKLFRAISTRFIVLDSSVRSFCLDWLSHNVPCLGTSQAPGTSVSRGMKEYLGQ